MMTIRELVEEIDRKITENVRLLTFLKKQPATTLAKIETLTVEIDEDINRLVDCKAELYRAMLREGVKTDDCMEVY